jgi:hypothetical protein
MEDTMLKISIPLVALSITAGCAAQSLENGPLDEHVQEAAQALTATLPWVWGGTANSDVVGAAPDLDLGPDNTQTCFLTGVVGALKGESYLSNKAQVGVFDVGGHWWLHTKAGTGNGVGGSAVCISATDHRQAMAWGGDVGFWGQLPQAYVVNPNTRCFLSKVEASRGFDGSYLGSPTGVWIDTLGPKPVLKGNLDTDAVGNPGGSAEALCVDIPAGWTGMWDGSMPAGDPTGTWNVGNNSGGGMGCFFTAISGAFMSGSSGTDGVNVTYDQNTQWWQVTMSSLTSADIECLE